MSGLSGRQLANALGVAPSAVSRAEASGRIKREADGLFDLENAKAAWAANTNVKQQQNTGATVNVASEDGASATASPETPPQAETLSEALRQKEWLKVQKEEMELKRKRGELVELIPLRARVVGLFIRMRDELTRLPEELRDVLAHETDPNRCAAILADRVNQILRLASEYEHRDEQRAA